MEELIEIIRSSVLLHGSVEQEWPDEIDCLVDGTRYRILISKN